MRSLFARQPIGQTLWAPVRMHTQTLVNYGTNLVEAVSDVLPAHRDCDHHGHNRDDHDDRDHDQDYNQHRAVHDAGVEMESLTPGFQRFVSTMSRLNPEDRMFEDITLTVDIAPLAPEQGRRCDTTSSHLVGREVYFDHGGSVRAAILAYNVEIGDVRQPHLWIVSDCSGRLLSAHTTRGAGSSACFGSVPRFSSVPFPIIEVLHPSTHWHS